MTQRNAGGTQSCELLFNEHYAQVKSLLGKALDIDEKYQGNF